MAELTVSRTTSGIVKSSPGYYTGYVVTTALSAAAITIYDGVTAAGTILDIIPASAAAGTKGSFAQPIRAKTGLYASFAGTGTVTFLYD